MTVIPFTDHQMVQTKLALMTKRTRGPGYWKLHLPLLNNRRYKDKIRKFLHDWSSKKNEFDNVLQWWEAAKVHIKVISSTMAKKSRQREQRQMTTAKNKLNRELEKPNPNVEQTLGLKKQIEELSRVVKK